MRAALAFLIALCGFGNGSLFTAATLDIQKAEYGAAQSATLAHSPRFFE